jgi:hypothetical protein
MKIRLFFAIALCLFVTFQSNAQMKITPDGVTSSDDPAAIHISGDVYEREQGPDGAVVSGVNIFSGAQFSCGGYFAASGVSAHGVYGSSDGSGGRGVSGIATGSSGQGVYGSATGTYGSGVYGYSTGTKAEGVSGSAYGEEGIGVQGFADGAEGRGVWGRAMDSGNSTNYGGYFEARGTYGRGVYATAEGYNGRGVYATAEGYNGKGVFGVANGGTGRGVSGYASGDYGRGVYGNGNQYDFYAGGMGSNYGPFTGAHEVKFPEDMSEEIVPGMIVSATGETETRRDEHGRISLSSTLPTVTVSIKPKDKAVFGVIVSHGPLPDDHWYKPEAGDRFGVVNSLGEGRVWVVDANGGIQVGDYITTSGISGYGQRQDDDILRAYTLGKAIETIDWDQVTKTVQHDGKTYKRYLIAVVYTSG